MARRIYHVCRLGNNFFLAPAEPKIPYNTHEVLHECIPEVNLPHEVPARSLNDTVDGKSLRAPSPPPRFLMKWSGLSAERQSQPNPRHWFEQEGQGGESQVSGIRISGLPSWKSGLMDPRFCGSGGSQLVPGMANLEFGEVEMLDHWISGVRLSRVPIWNPGLTMP